MNSELDQLGRRLYAFLQGKSDEPADALLTEDFAGHLTDGLPLALGGDYFTRDDMISRGWGRVGQTFEMHPDLEGLHVVGDNLLIGRGHYVGTAIPTGKPVRAAFAHFWTVTDNRVNSVYQVTDSAAWEHALG